MQILAEVQNTSGDLVTLVPVLRHGHGDSGVWRCDGECTVRGGTTPPTALPHPFGSLSGLNISGRAKPD